MNKKNNKIETILDETTTLLKNKGDFSVTMRKVAQLCGMSLSNLQYYFKNKDELLKAAAERYFQQCLQGLKDYPVITSEDDLKSFITKQFSLVIDVSDMCRIFREYWAISTRNAEIESYLTDYYSKVADELVYKLKPVAIDEECLTGAVTILISLIEGYSVTAESMPIDHKTMDELTHNTALSILKAR